MTDVDLLPPALPNALTSHLCILDSAGKILWVNEPWRQFASANGGTSETTGVGANYLAEHAAGGGGSFMRGLREILAGRRSRASVQYPCHSPNEARWFLAEASALTGPGPGKALVAHHALAVRPLGEPAMETGSRMEALGTLACSVAHDFNNLLSVMLGRLHLLGEDLVSGHPGRAHLEAASTAAHRARELVSQILLYGRNQPRHRTPLDVRLPVMEALGLLRADLPEHVSLHATLSEQPLFAHTEALELTQLSLNLCRNAIDALQDRRGTVTVSLLAHPEGAAAGVDSAPGLGGPMIVLSVADTGVGMDDITLQHIFEPFFSTKPRGRGTGLGLAIVRRIVADVGGTIHVRSQPAVGTTIDVWLPQAVAHEDTARNHLPESRSRRASPRGRRLLLVDDDEVVGVTLELYLKRAGYEVERVDSGMRAIVALARGDMTVHAVITDQNMPGVTGLEVAAAIQQLQRHVPIVLMSGYVDAELEVAGAGLVGAIVNKERIYDDLLAVLSRIMGDHAADEALCYEQGGGSARPTQQV